MRKRTKAQTRKEAEARVAAKLLVKPLQPARPSFIISEDGEVVKGADEIWREDLTRPPLNRYCKGCGLFDGCVITKLAAVALCDKKST
jgi:hypothetical protein